MLQQTVSDAAAAKRVARRGRHPLPRCPVAGVRVCGSAGCHRRPVFETGATCVEPETVTTVNPFDSFNSSPHFDKLPEDCDGSAGLEQQQPPAELTKCTLSNEPQENRQEEQDQKGNNLETPVSANGAQSFSTSADGSIQVEPSIVSGSTDVSTDVLVPADGSIQVESSDVSPRVSAEVELEEGSLIEQEDSSVGANSGHSGHSFPSSFADKPLPVTELPETEAVDEAEFAALEKATQRDEAREKRQEKALLPSELTETKAAAETEAGAGVEFGLSCDKLRETKAAAETEAGGQPHFDSAERYLCAVSAAPGESDAGCEARGMQPATSTEAPDDAMVEVTSAETAEAADKASFALSSLLQRARPIVAVLLLAVLLLSSSLGRRHAAVSSLTSRTSSIMAHSSSSSSSSQQSLSIGPVAKNQLAAPNSSPVSAEVTRGGTGLSPLKRLFGNFRSIEAALENLVRFVRDQAGKLLGQITPSRIRH